MGRRIKLFALPLLLCLLFGFAAPAAATALPPMTLPPSVQDETPGSALTDVFPFNLVGDDITAQDATNTVQIIVLLTILAIAPSILVMMTAFTRIVIILSFVRNAMGTQQMPPNQVMVGLALFLTFFVMAPVLGQIGDNAYGPLTRDEITLEEAFEQTVEPIRDFMHEQIRLQGNESGLRTFIDLAGIEAPADFSEVPTHVLIPAFITSEIKTAFKIGFLIYIPFIVIDMIVASVLMSMGMMMLPPVMISLPFKIMLFVLVDGWNLTVTSIVRTFLP